MQNAPPLENAQTVLMDQTESRLDRTISPNDGMFEGNEPHYFSVGHSGLFNIKKALASTRGAFTAPGRILDFPCGHGRVLRYLRAEFPDAEITACDLLHDGVDFCAKTFGAIPVYSDPNPARIELPRNSFDLIWVGSLFTHFDAMRWASFLPFLRDLLEPYGVLVFTTHGRQSHKISIERPESYGLANARSRQLLREYERTGFGYADYPAQNEYGISIAEPAWVCRLITSIRELRLIGLNEKSWDDHHDVYACVRDVAWKAHCTSAPEELNSADRSTSREDLTYLEKMRVSLAHCGTLFFSREQRTSPPTRAVRRSAWRRPRPRNAR